MDSLSEAFEALFMEGPYRFALQCVCKIERLFSVNVIRTSCLEVATSARVWLGAIVLVLACDLAPAAYASEGCSSSANGEPAVEASADAPALSEAVHPKKWLGIRRGFQSMVLLPKLCPSQRMAVCRGLLVLVR